MLDLSPIAEITPLSSINVVVQCYHLFTLVDVRLHF